ncbi:MAG: glycerophosphoryl diester phosphodiesterase [Alphaproteobacteria bacterium]|jgi:glycerophosphoryl diester phosphodiesterase|nr:glycerophosphoryl diester phosphodiesterase [Alphaproteobacteria bacterium]
MTGDWAAALLPRVIGHRGAARLAPENTLAGFRAAARAGAGMVEFDAQMAADGTPVVIHDATVDRTTDGSGPVAGLGRAELARLDAGSWFSAGFAGEPVPTLADALALCLKLGLAANIELKLEGEDAAAKEAGARIARAAAEAWPIFRRPPLLSSFSRAALAGAAEALPDWPRACLLSGAPEGWRMWAEAVDAVALIVHRRDGPPGSHAEFLEAARPVVAYTVNDPAEALALFAKGFVAVISDAPDIILKALAHSGEASHHGDP